MSRLLKVAVVDDSNDTRDSMCETLKDYNYDPIPVEGIFTKVEELLKIVHSTADVGVYDYRLDKFASFNGAVAAMNSYNSHFPVALVTTYGKSDVKDIRLYRRFVPALFLYKELTEDTLRVGFEKCHREFINKFDDDRLPVRTVVRVDSVDEEDNSFDVILSGWNHTEAIRLHMNLIDPKYKRLIRPGYRFTAVTNIGCERQDDLYFVDFEFVQ